MAYLTGSIHSLPLVSKSLKKCDKVVSSNNDRENVSNNKHVKNKFKVDIHAFHSK